MSVATKMPTSTWSVFLQIFVIFSCLFVIASCRPPTNLLQFAEENDNEALLNMQRLQKLPYGAASRFSPNQIYTLKRSNPWGNILTDDFAPAGGSDILGIMNYKGLRG